MDKKAALPYRGYENQVFLPTDAYGEKIKGRWKGWRMMEMLKVGLR